MQQPIIYCVCITGKEASRHNFMKVAYLNFIRQTYERKHLLIINHGKTRFQTSTQTNLSEVMIEKQDFTLGDLRNFALDLIPYEALWTVWDDDDWRHEQYLEFLYLNFMKHKPDALFIQNRLEYNLNTKFTYKSSFSNGIPFMFARKTELIRYLSKHWLEDENLQKDLHKHGKTYVVVDNDPRLYIRLIHETNTSMYVDKDKDNIVTYRDVSPYHEYNVTAEEKQYVEKIIAIYFRGKK